MANVVQTKKTVKDLKRKMIGAFLRNAAGWILVIPSITLFIIFAWRPIVIGISYAFFRLKGAYPVAWVGLQNFKDVLTDTNFIKTFFNTFKYIFWSFLIGFPLPVICAVCINELMHGKTFFKVATYLPHMLPGIAIQLVWKIIYLEGEGGLLNMILYYFGVEPQMWLSNKDLVIPLIIVTATWGAFGGTILLYLGTLQSINNELYEAARLDGAGFWQRLKVVFIPHMKTLILLNIIRQFMSVFNISEGALVMTGGGPNGASLSLGLTNYYYAFKYGQYDKSMALSVITFLILMNCTFIYFAADKKLND